MFCSGSIEMTGLGGGSWASQGWNWDAMDGVSMTGVAGLAGNVRV